MNLNFVEDKINLLLLVSGEILEKRGKVTVNLTVKINNFKFNWKFLNRILRHDVAKLLKIVEKHVFFNSESLAL